MTKLTGKRLFIVFLTLAFILTFFTTQAICEEEKQPAAAAAAKEEPPEKLEVSGKRYNVETSSKMIKLEDVDGHYVGLSEAIGVDIKSGAQAFSTTVSDTIMGNGTSFAYFKIVMPDGAIAYGRGDGKVSTVLSPTGKPITSVEGTWTVPAMSWTGKIYEGNGTFFSKVIGPGISSTQYEGEFRKKQE